MTVEELSKKIERIFDQAKAEAIAEIHFFNDLQKIKKTKNAKAILSVSIAAELYGVKRKDVLGNSRKTANVNARRLVMLFLRNNKYTSVEIANILNKDHSTVLHHLKYAKTTTEKKFIDRYNSLVVKINKL